MQRERRQPKWFVSTCLEVPARDEAATINSVNKYLTLPRESPHRNIFRCRLKALIGSINDEVLIKEYRIYMLCLMLC
jgi:hypothetical protein